MPIQYRCDVGSAEQFGRGSWMSPIGATSVSAGRPLAGASQFGVTPPEPATAAKTTANPAQIVAAQRALAAANSQVDLDKRNHSPGCVACDQKLVDKASIALAQAKAAVSSTGSLLDVSL